MKVMNQPPPKIKWWEYIPLFFIKAKNSYDFDSKNQLAVKFTFKEFRGRIYAIGIDYVYGKDYQKLIQEMVIRGREKKKKSKSKARL